VPKFAADHCDTKFFQFAQAVFVRLRAAIQMIMESAGIFLPRQCEFFRRTRDVFLKSE
jgi:hypothetical protein